MSKNPVVNALAASGYITLIVSVMSFITQTMGDKPDSFFAPIVFLSLFTLSASVMVCLFFYQPLQLFIKGKKEEALKLLIQTILVFGVITLGELILLLFVSP